MGENDCGGIETVVLPFPLWKPWWVAIKDYSGQVSKLAVRLGNVLGLGPRHAAKTRVCLMYACVCVAKSWRNSDTCVLASPRVCACVCASQTGDASAGSISQP